MDLTEQEDYEFPHPIQRWVMPLFAEYVEGGAVVGTQALGTAFAIGPGLLLTAAHVFDPIRKDSSTGSLRDDVPLRALFVTTEQLPGSRPIWGGPLVISEVVVNEDHDLALLKTHIPQSADGQQAKFSVAPLTLKPPEVGTPLLALGYAESKVEVATTPDGLVLEVNQKVTASRGFAQEHFFPRRDKAMIRFPTMQGDYPSLSGMSGGPVITDNGHVCGVVCSAVELGVSDWTSYCSLMLPLFTLAVEGEIDGVIRSCSLLELAERGVVPTDGSHKTLEYKRDGDDTTIVWREGT